MNNFVKLWACSAPFQNKKNIYKIPAFLQRHIHELYLFEAPRLSSIFNYSQYFGQRIPSKCGIKQSLRIEDLVKLGQTAPQTKIFKCLGVFVCECIRLLVYSKLKIRWPVKVLKSPQRVECHLLCHMQTQTLFFKSIVFFQCSACL